MSDDSKVIVALRLVGGAAFAEAAHHAETALKGVGEGGRIAATGISRAGQAGTVAASRLGRARAAAAGMGTAMRNVGRGVGVAGAAVGVATLGFVALAKEAFEKVQTLGEAAAVLHGVAGLSEGDGLRLAAVAQATGVKSRQLGMSLKALSTQSTQAAQGNKTSAKTFKLLGISVDEVKKQHGSLTGLLELVAAGMEKTRGGAGKLAAASKLLGRGWMGLNPILEGGGAELRSLTRFAASLGITLDGNTSKNLMKARDASYRWKLVMMAVQLFIVNKLIPALIAIASWINTNVIPAIRSIAGAARDTVKWTIGAFNGLMNFFGGLHDGIAKATSNLWGGLKTGLVDTLNWIIDTINGVIGDINAISSAIPIIGGNVLHPLGRIVPSTPGTLRTQGGKIVGTPPSGISRPPAGGTLRMQGGKIVGTPPSGINRPPAAHATAAASPLVAHLTVNLDSQVLHRGIYRVERAKSEA